MANINVTMTVDTVALSATPSNVAAACSLSDGTDPSGSTNFIINANVGDTVAFTILPSDGSTALSFSSFAYESGMNGVFNPLPESSNQWTGTVANDPANSEESFYIYFCVPSIQADPFRLDPEIKVKPRGN